MDLSERDGDEAFRQAAQKALEDEGAARPRPGEKRATPPGLLAPRPGGEKSGEKGREKVIDATDPKTLGAPDTSKVGPKAELIPPPMSDLPARVEQLSLGGDITYRLPDPAMLTPGPAHKTRSETNDRVVESLTNSSTSSTSTPPSRVSRAVRR